MSGQLLEVLQPLIEAAKRPGVMSLAGQLLEKQTAKELTAYFNHLAFKVKQAHLERFVQLDKSIVRGKTEQVVTPIVKRQSWVLEDVLKRNYHEALMTADKQNAYHEADPSITVGDTGGLLSDDAAAFAAQEAAQQVQGINATTIGQIADLISLAVGNQMTPADTSLDLQDLFEDMSKTRADVIARTEMARAFAAAAGMKFEREGIEYKQLILSPDACPICEDIAAQGPIPVDDDWDTDDGDGDGPPIHPNCRCAVVGARAPEDEDE